VKYALVTGGSRGIGRSICTRLAEMGYNILLNYRNNDLEAEKTKIIVESNNVICKLLKFDVSNKDAINESLGTWIESNLTAEIEILVHNAGQRQDNLLLWMNEEQWKIVISTNLDAFYYITRLVINGMLMRRYGRIINIVSLSGIKGLPGQTNYSAAKAGMIGATKSLALEVAKRGITVNAVAPGFIKTDMTANLDEKKISELVPMKRFGTPDEVADVVGFFASKDTSYITGEVLTVSGGLN
jgi:3-oxoacyl-[acyl-carrier protein] reductase